jgi:hypothetical protein
LVLLAEGVDDDTGDGFRAEKNIKGSLTNIVAFLDREVNFQTGQRSISRQ